MSFMDSYKRSLSFPDLLLKNDGRHAIRYKDPSRWAGQNLQYVVETISAFKNVQPDPVEFALLKNIAFWNPSVCSSESKSLVNWKQQQFIVALEEYTARKQKISTGYHGRLLLLITQCEKHAQFSRNVFRTVCKNSDPLITEVYIREVDY